MKKERLDSILIQKGLVKDSREAFIVVTEGRVFVGGQKAISPAQPVSSGARVEVRPTREYVGRGALKLEAALHGFLISARDKICMDVGAATGGFTQVLLKEGAEKIYAIDTAHGKFDASLRNDPRVIVMEATDIRDVKGLPEEPQLVTIDVSLISLQQILPTVRRLSQRRASIVALFKPQYEARDKNMLKHGIIKDDQSREALICEFEEWLHAERFTILSRIESPILGSKGNKEYLFHLKV